jgi:transcription elongation factor GreA
MVEKPEYLTQQGLQKLQDELQHLISVKREEVSERIRRAKEFSDTIDNAEYDEAKSELAFVEGRVQTIERMLAHAQVIPDHRGSETVQLGSRVTVVDAEGEEDVYHIVGSAEADPRQGSISYESPVGRALLGKRVGQSADVVAPGGAFSLSVVAIE